MKNQDILDPKGHLEIWKIYEDGNEELFFDEDNTITSGMGVGLGMMYAGSGATDITNFQIRNFQLGVSGQSKLASYGPTETLLVSALGQVRGGSDYLGVGSPLMLMRHELMDWNGAPKNNSEGGANWYFGTLPDSAMKRVDTNSITYIIYIDKNTCNNLDIPINEIGLFMQNPIGNLVKRSNLVAYRPFTNIQKTEDFSLVFKWTLNF